MALIKEEVHKRGRFVLWVNLEWKHWYFEHGIFKKYLKPNPSWLWAVNRWFTVSHFAPVSFGLRVLSIMMRVKGKKMILANKLVF